MVYQRFEGMKTVPSKQQAEALLHKQPTEASREDFGRLIIEKLDALLSKLLPKDTISAIQPQESNRIMSITPATPPILPKTSDPPDFDQISATSAAEIIKASSLLSLTSKTRKIKPAIPLKYSCDEIYKRMENGLCIFCEERDTPGHQDLKHKGVEILMIEDDNEPFVPESEPIVEEILVESDKYVTAANSDVFSESLEGFTSDLQIFNAAVKKEDQYKNYAENIVNFSLGRKIQDMMGQQSQKVLRVWEPGGCLVNTDRQMLKTEAVLHGQEIYVFPEKISQACQSQNAHLVWELSGFVGKQALWNCLDKYLKNGVELKLNAKTHETCLHNTLEVFSAEETQTWMMNEKMSFKVLPDPNLEAWVRLAIYGFKYQKLMSLLVKESRRVWERGGLTATCALVNVMPPFDISFGDMIIQEMRKSCVLSVVGSATMRMMRWLHMIELVSNFSEDITVLTLGVREQYVDAISMVICERKKTRSRGSFDYTAVDTTRTSTEGFISSCKLLLVVSTMNLVVDHKFRHVLILCRNTMICGHALDEIHEMMVKQNLPQVQLLAYPFDIPFSKAAATMVGYGINSTEVGDKNKNGSVMSRRRSIRCHVRRHVHAYEDKRILFQSYLFSSAVYENKAHENELLVKSKKMHKSEESDLTVCLIGVIYVKGRHEGSHITDHIKYPKLQIFTKKHSGYYLVSVFACEWFHSPRPPEILFYKMHCDSTR